MTGLLERLWNRKCSVAKTQWPVPKSLSIWQPDREQVDSVGEWLLHFLLGTLLDLSFTFRLSINQEDRSRWKGKKWRIWSYFWKCILWRKTNYHYQPMSVSHFKPSSTSTDAKYICHWEDIQDTTMNIFSRTQVN